MNGSEWGKKQNIFILLKFETGVSLCVCCIYNLSTSITFFKHSYNVSHNSSELKTNLDGDKDSAAGRYWLLNKILHFQRPYVKRKRH